MIMDRPVLGPSIQERPGHTGGSEMLGHEDDAGTGAFLL